MHASQDVPSRHRYTCGFCGFEQIVDLGPEDSLGTSYEHPHTYGPRVAPPGEKRSSHLAMLYCTETRLRYAGTADATHYVGHYA